jgi:hypothetical protein
MAQPRGLPETPVRDAPTDDFLGFLKYTGKAVETGLLDATKAAHALIGLDEAVRFFVSHQAPELASVEYEFPVLIRSGSWEALIPQTLVDWIIAGGALAATTYLSTAAKKAAERDFEKIGLKEIFTKSLEGIQWLIRIGKHLGQLTHRQVEGVRWRRNNDEAGILGPSGEYLYVPRAFYELYLSAPPHLLAKIAAVVAPDRILVFGVFIGGHVRQEEITADDKPIFTGDQNDEDVLFPELTHGLPVALDGFVTRGNATANTLGFKYLEHILTCHPLSGSIVTYKPFLFGPACMIGTITREDEHGGRDAKRPRIVFSRLEPLDKLTTSLPLFPDSGDEERT